MRAVSMIHVNPPDAFVILIHAAPFADRCDAFTSEVQFQATAKPLQSNESLRTRHIPRVTELLRGDREV